METMPASTGSSAWQWSRVRSSSRSAFRSVIRSSASRSRSSSCGSPGSRGGRSAPASMSRTSTRRAGAQAAVIATLTEDGARHDHLLGPRIFGVVWLVGALTDHRGPAWGRRAEPGAPDLLDRRLADGSISVEDYRERRELLKRSTDDD